MQNERSQDPSKTASALPWWAVVVAAVVALLSLQFGARIVARLADMGVPAIVAHAVFLLASGSLLAAVIFVAVWRQRSKQQRFRFVKTVMFLLVTLVAIITCQAYLQTFFYELGWAPEVRDAGAWLLAIIVIGSLAKYVAKRADVDLSRQKRNGA